MNFELEVCDSCLRAVCWWGLFHCDDYQTAGLDILLHAATVKAAQRAADKLRQAIHGGSDATR